MSRQKLEGEPGQSLRAVQEKKIGLVRAGGGRFTLNIAQSAMALGIPAGYLQAVLQGEGKAFVVAPSVDRASFVFSIEDLWPGRDIWQEVLGSLGRGRSEIGKRKEIYLGLFYACKAIWEHQGAGIRSMIVAQGSPSELREIVQFAQEGGKAEVMEEVGLEDLQAVASVVFLTLPRGIREELKGSGCSPDLILSQRM